MSKWTEIMIKRDQSPKHSNLLPSAQVGELFVEQHPLETLFASHQSDQLVYLFNH